MRRASWFLRVLRAPSIQAACALLALAAACSEPAAPPDPAPVRFAVETAGYAQWRAVPLRKGVPHWRHDETVIQHDERDADRLTPGTVLERGVTPGARAVETAFGVRLGPHSWIEDDRTVHLTLELSEGGARRVLFDQDLSVHAVLAEGWHPFRFELDPPARSGARLAACVTLLPAATREGAPATPEPEFEFALARAHVVGAGAPPKKPNVLVLSVDTLRADHLSCYGYARPTSPRIDALAARGVLFEHCTSTAPWTLPSYGSLFTSRSPIVHRAGVNRPREEAWGSARDVPEETAFEDLRPDLPTWAELMSGAGWSTAGFHSNPFLRAGTGVERGFQRWTWYWTRANAAVELSRDWIGRHADAPWFAFVHFIDPHQPYAPPAPYDTKWSSRAPEAIEGFPRRVDDVRAHAPDEALRADYVGLYDGEIAYTDAQIGVLLDALEAAGELADTIVVLHADHGEEFWEHGGYEHGHSLVEEVVHVPLIVVWPGHLPAGVRVTDRVSLLDVMPTVLALAGVSRPARLEGVDLAPTWERKPLGSRALLCDTLLYGPREAKSLLVGNDKLVATSGESPKLFDLLADPREASDVAGSKAGLVQTLKKRLVDRVSALQADSKRAGLSDFQGVRRALADTGYVGFEEREK